MTDQDPKAQENVEDLDVEERDADEVKGGDGVLRNSPATKTDPVARYHFENAWPNK